MSKRTLYNHIESKDAVVTAYLQRREHRWRARLERALEGVDSPVRRILAYVDAYCQQGDLNGHRGCPFINASAEISDPAHSAVAVIQGSVDNVEQGVAAILAEAGVDDPHELAGQILLVLEGAMSLSGIRRNGEAYETAERLIETLVGVATAPV